MIENISPSQVWDALRTDPKAELVDVRTDAEWTYVGLPDLTESGKQPHLIPWQLFPTMQVNGGFMDMLRESGLTPEHRIFFLCRSGVRSLAAARAAQAVGYAYVYNIEDGFEGGPDAAGHRGQLAGWKASGLPWRQR